VQDVQHIISLKRHHSGWDDQNSRTVGGYPRSAIFLSCGYRGWLIPAGGKHRIRHADNRHTIRDGDWRDNEVSWENGIMDENLKNGQRPGSRGIDDFSSRRIPAAPIDGGSCAVIRRISTGVQSICFDHRTPCSNCVRTDRTCSRLSGSWRREIGVA
jgi:hypothetical protein